MKRNLKGIWFYAIAFVVLIVILAFMYEQDDPEAMSYYKMTQLFENEQVESFVLDGNVLAINLKDGTEVKKMLPSRDLFILDMYELIKEQSEKGIISDYDLPPPPEVPWWVGMMPYVAIIIIFILLWMYLINQTGGGGGKVMSFGRAKTKTLTESQKKVTFKDVAGADEEKEELKEVVDFLRDPRKFIGLGARIPTGILMVGPPGTGKTLLAKAVAGEAGVPFFSISGSDFVEMFVGVGASRVRDLFDQAKKSSPCIIFIDEIDAVGRHRGAGLGGGHDEREQTLNQLLVEMDGFGVNEGIIIIAATNRPDILDPALLRPGRFDRQVYVTTPDIKGREEILQVHSAGKPLDDDVNLATIAKTTPGFTGADLENLMNEAALLAARRDKKKISMQEIEEATIKVVVGPEKKSRVISDKEKKLTAFHEAGHAIATFAHPERDPVHQISIIPRGRAGGFTLSLPKEDRYYMSKKGMLEEIVILLGGRVAEKMVLDDISTGASNDLERASSIARKMVTRYGMSEKIGPIVFGQPQEEIFLGRDFNTAKNYSETVAAEIDEEVKAIIDNAYGVCHDILEKYMDKLHIVAEGLMENEKLDGEEFARIMAGEALADIFVKPTANAEEPAPEKQSSTEAEACAVSAPEENAAPESSLEEAPASDQTADK